VPTSTASSGKAESAQARARGRLFSRHLHACTCKVSQLYRSPSGCGPPSNPTSNLSPAAAFAASPYPAPSLLAARESHNPHLLACAGMAINIHIIHREQAELLTGATGAPAVRSRWAGAAVVRAAGWCSRADGPRATSSPPQKRIPDTLSNSIS